MRRRLTAKFERIKQAAGNGLRREITDDFKYDKKKLKHLKHILHNVNVSLGTLVSALNEFSRLKGPDVSPDGMLGGLGYIMPIKEIKDTINTSVRSLSDVADSLADEMENPRWNAEDDKEVKELLKEKEEIEDKVEEQAEEDAESDINPDDVITSREVCASDVEKRFASAVSEALVSFACNGNYNSNKEH